LRAQSLEAIALRFAGMTAVTGLEQAMTDSLLALLPGSTRDRTGNVTLTLGQGAPKRLLQCPLDEVGYVVGNITGEGYLLLRRVGARTTYPLFDQQIEGHRVTVFVAFTVQSLYASDAGLASVKALLGPFTDIKTASLPTRYTDTAVETVALADVDKLQREMVQWMEGR